MTSSSIQTCSGRSRPHSHPEIEERFPSHRSQLIQCMTGTIPVIQFTKELSWYSKQLLLNFELAVACLSGGAGVNPLTSSVALAPVCITPSQRSTSY